MRLGLTHKRFTAQIPGESKGKRAEGEEKLHTMMRFEHPWGTKRREESGTEKVPDCSPVLESFGPSDK